MPKNKIFDDNESHNDSLKSRAITKKALICDKDNMPIDDIAVRFEYLKYQRDYFAGRLSHLYNSKTWKILNFISKFKKMLKSTFYRPKRNLYKPGHLHFVQSNDSLPPKSAKPVATIIIVTHNALFQALIPCLESIENSFNKSSYSLVIVDNASGKATRDFLKDYQASHNNTLVIYNSENLGFAAANNQALSQCRSDYIILLNSDTIVSNNWIDKMAAFLDSHPEFGMAGPVTNRAGNMQMLGLQGAAAADFINKGNAYALDCSCEWFTTNVLGFFCVIVRSELIKSLGPLDENYGLGFFEDEDFCLRAVRAGYKLAVLEDVFVYHGGSLSFYEEMNDARLHRLFVTNLIFYENKFNTTWLPGLSVKAFAEYVESNLALINPGNLNHIKNKINARLHILIKSIV